MMAFLEGTDRRAIGWQGKVGTANGHGRDEKHFVFIGL